MSEKIEKKPQMKIGIMGMGYVGLPLALEFLKSGQTVTGFEVDKTKVQMLKKGKSYIQDVPHKIVQEYIGKKLLIPTLDFKNLSKMDAIIVCVPTPLRKTKDPDISYILSSVNQIEKYVRKGQLIVLESTTYPGTTREVMLPILQSKGFVVGKDFYLAFSPERVDPGNKRFGIHNTPKIVGGITKNCTDRAIQLYSLIVEKVVRVSSTETAEMVKLLENTFRSVNIGLVNEVALMCDRMKLDTFEVIDAAATKPFGFTPFYPGPGLGGHCIPLDPHYLSWKLKTLNFYARFIELAGEINSQMPEHVVRKVTEALNQRKQSLQGSKILVLGVAYKKDINDLRESPALDVIEKLKEKGAMVFYHDPYIPQLQHEHIHLNSSPLSPALLKKMNCVVVTTDHSCFDMKSIVKDAKLIVDTRNATKGIRSSHIVKI